jgi:hypothetical protein
MVALDEQSLAGFTVPTPGSWRESSDGLVELLTEAPEDTPSNVAPRVETGFTDTPRRGAPARGERLC